MKKFQRIIQDKTDELTNLRNAHEKLSKQNEELNERYRETLQTNLELSKKLTSANEQYLASEKRAELLDENLKKAKRLAKITVSM